MRQSLTSWLFLCAVAFLFTCGACLGIENPITVYDLKCEYKVNPIGIDVTKPRMSWKLKSSARAVEQSAYQVRTAAYQDDLKSSQNLLWESQKVDTDQSTHVVYEGPSLVSRQRIWWQVRVWDNQGHCSDWSEPTFWEMGLLKPADWLADIIEPNLKEDLTKSNPCPLLRRTFRLKREIKSARAYVTCLGLYEMEINGRKVSDQLFTPGWTSYFNRLQYQTYDVTELLNSGKNCLGVTLGDGWYRGRTIWEGRRNLYGEKVALIAQVEVVYKNGKREIITSDNQWKASTGPILFSDIYDGELYDGRLEIDDWNKPTFDDSTWASVKVVSHRKDILVAPAGPPVKRIEEIRPIKIFTTPAGETVVDMGQNMVGWIRINVQGPAGAHVKLRHAEVLDAAGNFYTDNLRLAQQTVEYILKGKGQEVYEPHFTFQGFRYVAVDSWPGELSLDDLTGVVIHSDYKNTGTFECSNPMINQLQHNIKWGQKGNFLDVPTDCPQRDERLGWTGDAQVFARTACFNADVASFFTKWLADVSADQQRSGAVPYVIPNILSLGTGDRETVAEGRATDASGSAGWADAAVVVPWTIYLCYGDTRILEKQYPSMKAWVDYIANSAGDSYLWTKDHTFGDWCAFSTNQPDYPGATTDKDLIRQAYFAHSTDLLQRTAQILGKIDDAEKYATLLAKVKRAFQNEFLTPNGRVTSDTQTAYSLALAFDLLPADMRAKAAERLAGNVRKFKHITTGFLGTPLICHVLTEYGYLDEAYLLLNRREYPSWLYPITNGATTIWERWDGIKPDGSFQDIGMNSFNHYAYGAIGDWLYRTVAGIQLDEQSPGYKHIIIQPHPGGSLTHAKARLESMYGPIESGWHRNGKETTVKIEVPPNTRATVKLPSARIADVRESGKKIEQVQGVSQIFQQGDRVVVRIGSGRYLFEYGE